MTMDYKQSWAEWMKAQPPFVAGVSLPVRLRMPIAADFERLRDELNGPRLELATTRQLLQELVNRLDVAGRHPDANTMRFFLNGSLPAEVLDGSG